MLRREFLNLSWKIITFFRKRLRARGFEIRRIQGSIANPSSCVRLEVLRNSPGVLHVGAHYGQEAQFYEDLKLNVLWVEGDPVTYSHLTLAIKARENQEALLALLGNEDSENASFYRTSNQGQSSSLYPLAKNLGFKPVAQEDTAQLPMRTLDSLFPDQKLREFPYWLLDVQGAELLVLQGAERNLRYCMVLELEVSTFPIYENQPLFEDLTKFLSKRGFFPIWNPPSRFHGNIIYLRKPNLN
jgi:FkbM family methyltransferase